MIGDDGGGLIERVRVWLNSRSGATVEMAVAHTFTIRGFDVNQGIYLPDPQTGDAREIDVIATREVRLPGKAISVHAVIECEYAPKPWVLMRGHPRHDAGRPNLSRVDTNYGTRRLSKAGSHPAIEQARIFAQEPRAAYALTTV